MEHGASTTTRQAHYHVPQPMPWPIMGAFSLFCMALGSVILFNGASSGWIGIALGFMILLYMMFRWLGDVIRESEGGKYGAWEDVSFRWGMSWFIFSEVMFFAGFFGALFWARVMSVPDLASLDHNTYLWPNFTSHWPSAGPGFEEKFSPMGAWGLPAINTALLLTSGVTVTLAHWALLRNDRLKLTTGAYGTTFFMLTGFHGFHVTCGAIMLTVIWFRCLSGHFKPDHHFGFEGVAWYWHFVDVVWIGLFTFVYVL